MNFASDTVVLWLAPDSDMRAARVGTLEFSRGGRKVRLNRLDAGVAAALRSLSNSLASAAQLTKTALSVEPAADTGRLMEALAWLAGRSIVGMSCVAGDTELLRAIACGPLADFDFTPPLDAVRVRLSRFAYMRRRDTAMVITSPAVGACIEIAKPFIGALLIELALPATVPELCDRLPTADPAQVRAAAFFLLGTGVLAITDSAGRTPDETRRDIAQREFHDVVFHAASRRGLTQSWIGGSYRFLGSIPPAPAIGPLPDGERFTLPRPDLDSVINHDPPFGEVMRSRRSIRSFAADPITSTQLGEFLFRVAHVEQVRGIDATAGRHYETSHRPCPSGGGSHDIEIYLTIGRCAGLGRGIYHYDPAGHQLTLVCDRQDLVHAMLAEACLASGTSVEPQVLITLASRFTRLSWKYEGIAYAITLKNAGALYAAMYLVATAMDLAPCGLGCGDSAVFSIATGLDPLAESAVGEFMLGTREGR